MNVKCPKCQTPLVQGETTQLGKIRHTSWMCPTCRKTRAIAASVGY